MSRARRFIAAAMVALTGAGVLSACSGGASSYAAIVNGHTISASTLVRELDAVRSNAAFMNYYQSQVQAAITQGQILYPVVAADSAGRTYNQGFAAVVLNTDIQGELIHDEVVRRHVEPTASEIDSAANKAAAGQQFLDPTTQQSMLPGFPLFFQQEFWKRAAEDAALDKALGPAATDAAAVTAYYNQNLAQFITGQCVSHILVTSQAEAVRIHADIVHGATFANEALHYSGDLTSAIKGGDLGCTATGQFGQTFQTVADAIPVNQVSQPVHTIYGWHLILVRSRTLTPLNASTVSTIQGQLTQGRGISVFVNDAMASAKVSVSPAFGSWDPIGRTVVPPVAPPDNVGVPVSAPPVVAPSATAPSTP